MATSASNLATDPEISCRITKTLLLFVREKNNGSLGSLLDGLELDEAYLLDPHNWVSHAFLQVLYRRMIDMLGDADAVYHMALGSDRLQSLGLLNRVGRLLGHPRLIYSQSPIYNRLLKRNGDVFIREMGDSWVLLEDRYHSSDQKTRCDCDYTRGILEGIPTLFDMPPARIQEIECQVAAERYGKRVWEDSPMQGGGGCLYRVEWEAGRKPRFWDNLLRSGIYRQAVEDLLAADRKIQEKYDEARSLAANLQKINRELQEIRRQQEANLARIEASETKYRLLAENLSDIIWTLSLDTMRFTYISPSVEKFRGFTVQEAMALSIEETLTPQSIKDATKVLAAALAEEGLDGVDPNRSRTLIIEQLCKDGSSTWGEVTMTFIRSPEGRPVGILGVTRDISQRRLVEESLQRSEEKYRQLAETAHDLIVTVGLDFKILYVNQAVLNLTGGMSPVGGNLVDYTPPHLHEIQKVLMQKRSEGFSDVLSFEWEVDYPVGRKSIFDIRSTLLKDNEKPSAVLFVAREITERKKAEALLRESEARLSRAQEIAHLGNWEYDTSTGAITWSDESYRIFGFKPQSLEITPELIRSRVHPDDLRKVERALEDVRSNFGQHNIEYRIVLDDGAVRYVHSQRDVSDSAENSKIIFGTLQDITQRKQAEDLIRESEERYRAIFNNTAIGIGVRSLNNEYIEFNEYYRKMLGYTEEELKHLKTEDITHPDDIPISLQNLDDIKTGKAQIRHYEKRYVDKQGNIVWCEVSVQGLKDRQGNIRAVAGTINNITDRKRAEQILRESEKKFRDMAELLPAVVFEFDRQGRLTYVNRFAFELFRYTQADFDKGLSALDMIAPHDRERGAVNVMKMMQQDMPTGTEYMAVRANGEEFPVIIYSTPIYADGKAIGLRGIVADITERKHMEERLQRSEKMEALGTLAGGVAHDLNNVLGVLVGYSELLAEKLPAESPLRRYADNILQSGIRGAAIIQDLLTLARRGVTVTEVVDLNQVVLDYFRTPEFENMKVRHPQVRVLTELEPGLLNIKGSTVHLGKTIMNLILNAVESIAGRGEVTVRTQNSYLDLPVRGYDTILEGEYAVLTVSDTGMGISPDDMGKIFEPFYTKKVMGRSGTGLGLAVVWGAVKDHGGYIDVQSEEGRGSTFTLYFPVARGEATRAERPASRTSYTGRGERLLVVDDVKEQRELALNMLERLGYRVEAVSSGEEALAYLGDRAVDLVILDMIMEPGMDGLETYRRMLEIRPGQRAIIVSGFSETERVRQAQELGAGAFVRKPYILEKIGLAVRSELDR